MPCACLYTSSSPEVGLSYDIDEAAITNAHSYLRLTGVFAKLGFDEGVAGHLTYRDPIRKGEHLKGSLMSLRHSLHDDAHTPPTPHLKTPSG